MKERRSDFDITNRIQVSRPRDVCDEIGRIYKSHYPSTSFKSVDTAFSDFLRLYRGEFPGYRACDTLYHDIQHTLDVTLAMTRLLDGYLKSEGSADLMSAERMRLGIIVALFHDAGYIRHISDRIHKNGAEYTRTHVSRSAYFLQDYLPEVGLTDLIPVACKIVHFTGYEVELHKIRLPDEQDHLLGMLLGTADLIAQMSDRCYLEKCRDRLFQEFVMGGIAEHKDPDGKTHIVYDSPEDLLRKTPAFFEATRVRLESQLDGVFKYAGIHFGGVNHYMNGFEQNFEHLNWILSNNMLHRLERIPPTHNPPYAESE